MHEHKRPRSDGISLSRHADLPLAANEKIQIIKRLEEGLRKLMKLHFIYEIIKMNAADGVRRIHGRAYIPHNETPFE